VVAKGYSDLVFDLHDAKAAPEMVAMARAGILYMLDRARDLAASDAAKAANWRKAARALAYNLGSFAWPGWGEEGFPIGEAERAAGEEAARTSLRLATELAEGPQSLSAGHWIVGAHHLAAKRYDEAIRSFTEAGAQSRAAKDRPGELMAAGYAALAEILAGRDAKDRFEDAVAQLRKDGSEDAVFYADQLGSVLRVLSK
jgi:hypothetical protein